MKIFRLLPLVLFVFIATPLPMRAIEAAPETDQEQEATDTDEAAASDKSETDDDEAEKTEETKEEVKPSPAQQIYLDYLSDEGFKAHIDSDGDIGFKYEGGDYYVIVDEDEQFFRLVYPAFWKLDDDAEINKALVASEQVNDKVKTGKVMFVGEWVWASVESFVEDREDFKPIFTRSLGALRSTWRTFIDEMNDAE